MDVRRVRIEFLATFGDVIESSYPTWPLRDVFGVWGSKYLVPRTASNVSHQMNMI